MIVVVDASVAAMWFLPEEQAETAALLLTSQFELIAPDLIRLEVGSALLKALRRKQIAPADCEEALRTLLPAAVRFVPTSNHVFTAFGIAQRLGGSIYDATYISLAQSLDAPVITNDAQLAAIARKARVKAMMVSEGPRAILQAQRRS